MNTDPNRIATLFEIELAAENKRALVSKGCFGNRPKPAAVWMNLAGTIILRSIKSGLFIYTKPEKEAK